MREAAPPLSVSQLEDAVQTVLESNFDADTKVLLTTLLKIIDNLLGQPHNPKVRQLRLENPALKSKILALKGGLEVLLACGFTQEAKPPPLLSKTNEDGEQLLVYEHEDLSFLRTARRLIVTRVVQDLGVKPDQIPKEPAKIAPVTSLENANFNVYSGHRYDAASAALGIQVAPDAQYVSKTETALKALAKKQEQLEQQLQKSVVDRSWTATRPGEAPAAASVAVAAASAPEPPKTDSSLVAARMQRQQNERNRQEAGFTTQAMRDLERMQKSKVYSHTVLTLQFDDGCKLSGCFLPSDKIGQVRQALQKDCLISSQLEFDLVVTPPRRVLNQQQTLQQEGLVPAAKVVVSWKSPQQRGKPAGWYLQPHLFASSQGGATAAATPSFPESRPIVDETSSSVPEAAAAPAGVEKPPSESREDALLRRMMGGGGRKLGTGSSSAGTSKPTTDQPKKPKWFKG